MKKIIICTSLIIINLMMNNIAYAEVSPVPTPPKVDSLSEATFPVKDYLTLDKADQPKKYFDDKKNSPIVSFILSGIDFATIIVGSIAMILFIIAGFMFMFAQGNQQQVDEAKDIIKYATIGLVVIFLSYLITIFVQSIFIAD